MFFKKTNLKTPLLNIYYIGITLFFIYIFVQFLTMKRSNTVYRIYTDYIMDKYCFLLYLFLAILIMKIDIYTSVLLLILAIGPFKTSIHEFFESPTTTLSSIPSIPNTQPTDIAYPTTLNNDLIVTEIPKNTDTKSITYVDNPQELIDRQVLGIDDRFKVDDVAVKDILRQIKSQVEFDPYKTNLEKDVISEIYKRYFDNDIFIKLKVNNDDSKDYIAEGNFKYLPQSNKVDYDLVTYQNLNNNIELGISPLTDGVDNLTKINRG